MSEVLDSIRCDHGLLDNELDFHAYNDYGYHRYVTDLSSSTNINKKQLLIQVLSSIGSNVDKIHSIIASECVNCARCKKSDNTDLMADSGASIQIEVTSVNMK